MAESYIPEGTNVICTNMLAGPQQIGINRTAYVLYKGQNAPFLNELDKKLSASFQCKNASKFWGGLQALCAGIAIGALVVGATILTGGAATILIIAAFATAGVSIGAGITGIYKTMTDCDNALKSGEWLMLHNTVNIDGHKAILNRSFINCSKGGKITIIVDPVIAKAAGEIISNNNNKEVAAHMGSQFVMGLLTGATSATPIGFVVAAPLTIYSYIHSESDEQEQRSKNEGRDGFINQVVGAGKDELRNEAAGLPGSFIENTAEVTANNRQVQREIIEFGQLAVARAEAGNITGSTSASLAKDIASRSYKTPWKGMLKGLKRGFAVAVVNFVIDQVSNSYEDKMHLGAIVTADLANTKDEGNSINIIANT